MTKQQRAARRLDWGFDPEEVPWDGGDLGRVYRFLDKRGIRYCRDWVDRMPDGALMLFSDPPVFIDPPPDA